MMFYPTFIPIFYNNCNGGGKTPNILRKYLWFSLGFSIYGFSRGYRGLESNIKYKEKKKFFNEINNLQNRKNKIIHSINNSHNEKTETEKEKHIKYINNEINNINNQIEKNINIKKKDILFTDKIWYGFREVQIFYYPIFNFVTLFDILRRIDIWYNISFDNYDNYEDVFCAWYFNNCICYDII